ncbi:MAG: IMP dehydrogenase [Lewinellaceae bacterium]|nr:IMP dehydrogenase [Lewinellaceae bacterium]
MWKTISKISAGGYRRAGTLQGSVAEVMPQYIGGLRAGMGYCGARTIGDLQDYAQFVKITNAGMIESHPHNIAITRESPNYSRL